MKYLIIRLGAIGDVVHSTIIAQAIKTKYPQAEIHFLTSMHIASLLENNPFIDKVISFNIKHKDNIFYLLKLGFKFYLEKYDAIFSLSNTTRNIILSRVANPKRIIKRNSNRVHAVDAFYNTALDELSDIEKPERIIFKMNDTLIDNIKTKISSYPAPYFVFSPGGENDNARQGRIWADEYWVELGNKIVDKFGGTIFVCGSKSEAKSHEKFKQIKNAVILSGELSLAESATLYSLADLFVSGDSGPLHIAACFDINIVALYGSMNPSSVAPYGHKNSCIIPAIKCKFCGKKVCHELKLGEKITPCMKSITPDMVFDFIKNKNINRAL